MGKNDTVRSITFKVNKGQTLDRIIEFFRKDLETVESFTERITNFYLEYPEEKGYDVSILAMKTK